MPPTRARIFSSPPLSALRQRAVRASAWFLSPQSCQTPASSYSISDAFFRLTTSIVSPSLCPRREGTCRFCARFARNAEPAHLCGPHEVNRPRRKIARSLRIATVVSVPESADHRFAASAQCHESRPGSARVATGAQRSEPRHSWRAGSTALAPNARAISRVSARAVRNLSGCLDWTSVALSGGVDAVAFRDTSEAGSKVWIARSRACGRGIGPHHLEL